MRLPVTGSANTIGSPPASSWSRNWAGANPSVGAGSAARAVGLIESAAAAASAIPHETHLIPDVLPDFRAFGRAWRRGTSVLLPSPPMLRALALATVAALGMPGAAGARIAPLAVPTGTVTGSLRADWTEISRADPMTRTDATITFTIEDRLRSPGAAEAWVTEPIPDFARGV